MDDAQAVSLVFFRAHRSISFFLSLFLINETAIHLRIRLNFILLLLLLPLLIALQIPLVVTAKTQVPATRSCRVDIVTIPVATAVAVIIPQTIVVTVATVHHHNIVGDGSEVEGPIGSGANGK